MGLRPLQNRLEQPAKALNWDHRYSSLTTTGALFEQLRIEGIAQIFLNTPSLLPTVLPVWQPPGFFAGAEVGDAAGGSKDYL
jgi:hypothetical protein